MHYSASERTIKHVGDWDNQGNGLDVFDHETLKVDNDTQILETLVVVTKEERPYVMLKEGKTGNAAFDGFAIDLLKVRLLRLNKSIKMRAASFLSASTECTQDLSIILLLMLLLLLFADSFSQSGRFYICLPLLKSVYICLHLFTSVYICVHLFTSVYICLHLFTSVYYICVHLFTSVYICLHLFTFVYICLHLSRQIDRKSVP
jgi:hypothetical protein